VFYSLTLREWNAALRAHQYGDGHDRSHSLLAEIAAMIAAYIAARGGRKSDVKASDFLPWRPRRPAPKQDVDSEIRAYFRGRDKRGGRK